MRVRGKKEGIVFRGMSRTGESNDIDIKIV